SSDLLKPDQLQGCCIIAHLCHEALSPLFSKFLKADYSPYKLYARQFGIDFTNFIKFSAVNISEWVMLQKIADSEHLQLLFEHFCFLRAHALQILYRCNR